MRLEAGEMTCEKTIENEKKRYRQTMSGIGEGYKRRERLKGGEQEQLTNR